MHHESMPAFLLNRISTAAICNATTRPHAIAEAVLPGTPGQTPTPVPTVSRDQSRISGLRPMHAVVQPLRLHTLQTEVHDATSHNSAIHNTSNYVPCHAVPCHDARWWPSSQVFNGCTRAARSRATFRAGQLYLCTPPFARCGLPIPGNTGCICLVALPANFSGPLHSPARSQHASGPVADQAWQTRR